MNRLVICAIAISLILPLIGIMTGNLITTEGIIKAYVTCLFPLLLVINPDWIKNYFGTGNTAVYVGYFAYFVIFLQLVLL